jgi:hypothetical protein
VAQYKRGHNYWNEKHEDLVLAWTTATTQSEYTRIYNDLKPALNFMAELILNRYFSCPFHQQNEMKADAVQHCFLLMKKYHPSKVRNKNGAYSFCGMILKHFYLERLVLDKEMKKVVHNKLDYLDELPPEAEPIDYGESLQIPKDTILSHFNELLSKAKYNYVQEIKRCRRSKKTPRVRKHRVSLEILKLCKEFVEKYDSFNPSAMADYIYLNQSKEFNLAKTTITYYFRREFGVNVVVGMEARDLTYKVDERYNYLQDDFTPMDKERMWSKRSKRKKEMEKEKEKYLYM